MIYKILIAIILNISVAYGENAQDGNTYNQSYSKAKKLLYSDIYDNLYNETLYCRATFEGKEITDLNGFYSDKYKNREYRLETEHVVPASSFGTNFPSWKNGHPDCVTKNGDKYKGRRCASKVSPTYRYMQADLYNLYPSIGSVNALRSNYKYGFVEGEPLGNCPMVINNRTALPPEYSRGIVARISLYFYEAYPNYKLSKEQLTLFNSWNALYPVTTEECARNELIEEVQGNVNNIIKELCSANY